MAQLRVGQSSVDADKLVACWWVQEPEDVIVTAVEADGELVVIDGTTRAVAAQQRGIETVGVVLVDIDPAAAAARRACRDAGIDTRRSRRARPPARPASRGHLSRRPPTRSRPDTYYRAVTALRWSTGTHQPEGTTSMTKSTDTTRIARTAGRRTRRVAGAAIVLALTGVTAAATAADSVAGADAGRAASGGVVLAAGTGDRSYFWGG